MDSSSHPWESYFGIPTISFFFLAKIRKEAQATSVKIRLFEFMRLDSLIKFQVDISKSLGFSNLDTHKKGYEQTKSYLFRRLEIVIVVIWEEK